MRSVLVVIRDPLVDGLQHLREGIEQIGIEYFVPKALIKSLYQCVSIRIAKLDESQRDAMLLCPVREEFCCEFRAAIQSDGR